MIRAEALSFGFSDKDLYDHISFTLEEGRHCVLIGSNGSGKTTLVDLIRRPQAYLYDGTLLMEDIGRIGYVSQFSEGEKDIDTTVYRHLCEDFVALENKISEICTQMETAEDLEPLLEEYQLLLDESQAMDADNYEVNIRLQLHLAKLEEKADLPLSALSGGEYKLMQIIRQMLRRPGLLIMDEPDVFLDFENLNGLRELINSYEGTLLVITHDRYLLDHCFDQIWHLENKDLQEFDGNFREYNFSLLQKKIELQEASAAGEAEIQRATEMVEKLRKEATEVIDPRRGRTLKGKVSYLERMKKWQIKAPFVQLQQPEITFPDVAPADPSAILLEVQDYSLTFDETLLEHVSFAVHAHEKVAIVGPNGTGKTSMFRDIRRGQDPSIRFHEAATVGFFSQLQEEALTEKNTIYQEFYDLGFHTPAEVEEHLRRYCFDPEGLHRRVSQLSGGEKNLLQLAKLAVSGADLLLLDEPSSHLDIYAQMALEKAIAAYHGAVLMVSHDFYTIVNCVDRILYVENGTLRPMSTRGFRKMIYKHHFSREYLELEPQRKELELKIARCLEKGEHKTAKILCQDLGEVIGKM